MSIQNEEEPLILEAVKDALLRKVGGEVDLIFQYGSRLRGSAHKFSDLDLSYVPAHETTWESITVMVEGTLVDLYAIHWPHLEEMANFNDLSSMLLLENRILYQRTEECAERFRALADRLKDCLRPGSRPQMVRQAQEIFQKTGYASYLLRLQAAAGHRLGSCQQARSILQTVLHSLAVCNQACVDTRKMEQMLTLTKLPAGFAETVDRIVTSFDPDELLSACDTLLGSTRNLLLAEQRQVLGPETTFPHRFESAYPELQNDLHHVMLACERKDLFALKTSLISLYQELSLGIAQVATRVEYSDFNTLSEYEQDLAALGFPPLLPYLFAGDFEQLYRQCLKFGEHMKDFLVEHGVALNSYANLEDLKAALAADV